MFLVFKKLIFCSVSLVCFDAVVLALPAKQAVSKCLIVPPPPPPPPPPLPPHPHLLLSFCWRGYISDLPYYKSWFLTRIKVVLPDVVSAFPLIDERPALPDRVTLLLPINCSWCVFLNDITEEMSLQYGWKCNLKRFNQHNSPQTLKIIVNVIKIYI